MEEITRNYRENVLTLKWVLDGSQWYILGVILGGKQTCKWPTARSDIDIGNVYEGVILFYKNAADTLVSGQLYPRPP